MIEKKECIEATNLVLQELVKEKCKRRIKLLGREFVVYPNVFSPEYFSDTEFFAKELPVKRGEEFLEVGCGTGIISVFAALRGASRVISVDINPAAVRNAKENVRLHKMDKRIRVLHGDAFGPLKKERFDVIFSNIPFGYTKRNDLTYLERSVWDPEYRYMKKFVRGAKKYLKMDGRLIIGFSSTIGHMGELMRVLKESGYKYKIIKRANSMVETCPVMYEIIEARIAHEK